MHQEEKPLSAYFDAALQRQIEVKDRATKRYKITRRNIVLVIIAIALTVFLNMVSPQARDFGLFFNPLVLMFDGVPFKIYFFPLLSLILVTYTLFLYTRLVRMHDSLTYFTVQETLKKYQERAALSRFVALVLLSVSFVNAFMFSIADVRGESMEPSMSNGETVIIRHYRLTYDYFDIVVVDTQSYGYLVKRVIGLPGDTVLIAEDGVYLNSEKLDKYYLINDLPLKIGLGQYTVPDDHVFVLGDNLNNSTDSRTPSVGMVESDAVYGRVVLRYWPLHAFGSVNDE